MKLIKNRNNVVFIAFLALAGIIGLLPIEFLVSALLFAVVFRGWLYLINLAIATDPKTKGLDNS